jgi:peptidoglycan/xylan/chitin deacetylase (PgdA/CDA1 family)
MPLASFLEQLDYLQAHYQIISLGEFVSARHHNMKLPASAVILTFDDGMRNFFTVVAPLLLKRRIAATSFILTGESYMRESSELDGDWCSHDDAIHLSWDEVRQLAHQGVEFGSHARNHYPLPDLTSAEAHDELVRSLEELNTHLGPGSFPLSYPHGRTSERISRLTESLGYSCAVTTALGQNDSDDDLFELRRTVVASDVDLPTFAARLSGLTHWYSQAAKLFSWRTAKGSESSTDCYDPFAAEECN